MFYEEIHCRRIPEHDFNDVCGNSVHCGRAGGFRDTGTGKGGSEKNKEKGFIRKRGSCGHQFRYCHATDVLSGVTDEEAGKIIAGRPMLEESAETKNIISAATYEGIKTKIVGRKSQSSRRQKETRKKAAPARHITRSGLLRDER
jgi:hypothetical protein